MNIYGLMLAVATGAVLFSGSVCAQNVNSLDMRLDRLERDMQTLSRSVYKGDVPPPSVTSSSGMGAQQAAAIEVRMGQIEEQLRRLTGMIEETQYKIRKLENQSVSSQGNAVNTNTSNNNMSSDTSVSSTPLSSSTSQNQPYQLGTLNTAKQADGSTSPAELYDQAFLYMQKNDYVAAQGAFDEFLKQYPDHDLAANAKYWLAETFYARGDYPGASRAFALSYKDFPNGNKAPDSLLKLAMSLQQQDMTSEACLTLAEINKQFPNAPASIKSKVFKENQEYGCE